MQCTSPPTPTSSTTPSALTLSGPPLWRQTPTISPWTTLLPMYAHHTTRFLRHWQTGLSLSATSLICSRKNSTSGLFLISSSTSFYSIQRSSLSDRWCCAGVKSASRGRRILWRRGCAVFLYHHAWAYNGAPPTWSGYAKALRAAFGTYDKVRRTRTQWLVNSSLRVCDLFQQPECADPAKRVKAESCFERLKTVTFKIWHFDSTAMVDETIQKYKARLEPHKNCKWHQ